MEYKCCIDPDVQAKLAQAPLVTTMVNCALWNNFVAIHDNHSVKYIERVVRLIGQGINRGRTMDEVAPEALGEAEPPGGTSRYTHNLAMRFLMARHYWIYGEDFNTWVKSATNLCISCARPGFMGDKKVQKDICSGSMSGKCKYDTSNPLIWISFGEDPRKALRHAVHN